MSNITRIDINGLNGHKNVRLELRSRHCIIVGPNGSGKSTALQILAYALGRQWKSLSTLRFTSLALTFADGSAAVLNRDSAAGFTAVSGRFNPRFSRIQRDLIEQDGLTAFISADLTKSVDEYVHRLGLPPSDLRMAQRYFRSTSENKSAQKEVLEFQSALQQQRVPITLYLPTYRRIELELERMVGEIPEYVRRDLRIRPGISSESIVELVRFGMEDVNSAIQVFERQTRDFARNRFNRMMASYLKEMANSRVLSVGDLRSHKIDQDKVRVVLSRIEEGLLNEQEKAQITDIILELSSGPGAGNQPFNKKWLAHFFVRLLEVDTDIERLEQPIRRLVAALSKYFHPKMVSYDIENYHFSIKGEDGAELALSDLSSGEKQVVSILSQLTVGSAKSVNVLIDEPELSLSVPWQSELLQDIARTPACNQIFSVTHSPFIYDNSLSNSVVDFVEATY
jgi:predicted ATP-dependent endonuclease of OLD family